MTRYRFATSEDSLAVLAFYDVMIDRMVGSDFDVSWRHGIHPTHDFLRDTIENGLLLMGTVEETELLEMMTEPGRENKPRGMVTGEAGEREFAEMMAAAGENESCGRIPETGGEDKSREMVTGTEDSAASAGIMTRMTGKDELTGGSAGTTGEDESDGTAMGATGEDETFEMPESARTPQPERATQSVQTTQSVQPTQSEQTTQSVQPSQSVQLTRTIPTIQPAHQTSPEQSTEPSQPVQLAQPAQTTPSLEDADSRLADIPVLPTGERLVAAMALDHHGAPGYEDVPWQTPATADEAWVLHVVATHPLLHGHGLAKGLVNACIAEARDHDLQALRLDTFPHNVRGQRLYESCGFTPLGEHTLVYEEYGPRPIRIYELVLK